jgi:hypothetical protein
MDPDTNLAAQLAAAVSILALIDGLPDDHETPTAEEWNELLTAAEGLAEHVAALDGWIRSGGFLPKAWKATRGSSNAVAHAIELLTLWPNTAGAANGVLELTRQSRECSDELEATAAHDYAPLAEFLTDVIDYLDDRQDVNDGDDGQPRPNKAMQLLHAAELLQTTFDPEPHRDL